MRRGRGDYAAVAVYVACAYIVGFAFGAGDIIENLWQEAVMKFMVNWSLQH
jgi:hypothetical protein